MRRERGLSPKMLVLTRFYADALEWDTERARRVARLQLLVGLAHIEVEQ